MSRNRISSTFAAVLICITSGASADDLDKPPLSFAGYGTLGLTHSSENQADFSSNYLQPNGAGYTHNWSASVDSRLGLQATGKLGSDWSAIVQVISQQRFDNTYTPTAEWANLKYQATPDLSIRAGRIALPIFLTADYRNVGYAIPWVRAPGELYNLVPVTHSDGLDVSYRVHFGELTDTIKVAVGGTKINVPGDGHLEINAMRGIANSLEYGVTTVRLAYLQGNLNGNIGQSLFSAFDQFGPQGLTIAGKYDLTNKPIVYAGVGISYDPGPWFAMAEIGNIRIHSFLGDKSAGYATVGYRNNKFTPYLTYAQGNANSNRTDPGLSTQGLPPQLAAQVSALNVGLNRMLGGIAIQKSLSFGVRWDLMKNTALKGQYDLIQLGDGSIGNLVNAQPGFSGGGKASVASFVLDFVF